MRPPTPPHGTERTPASSQIMLGDVDTLSVDDAGECCGGPKLRPSRLLVGGKLGRYLILERLGLGGMGVVYVAYDPKLDRKVAIKLVRSHSDETGSARLLREAQAMAKLSHPNVVTVHDVGTVGDQVFVAMEFIDGLSLRDWSRARPRKWSEVLDVLVRAGRGLAAAHDLGLVHRDFKPENVMIGRDGRVLVLDFGLVRAAHDDLGNRADAANTSAHTTDNLVPSDVLTKAGSLVGTPAYMAPEQLHRKEAGPASDQFSFCVTLYESLYGERPHHGDTIAELGAAIVRGDLRAEPKSSTVPRWLRAALVRGLSLKSENRFGTMDELLAVLSHAPRTRRRLPLFVGIAAALGLTASIARTSLAQHEAELRAQMCHSEGQRIHEVWNDDARAMLKREFMRTGSPFADTSYERVTAWLDPWAQRWATERTSVCTRAGVDVDLGPQRYERALGCFAEQRDRLAAMLEVFGEPNLDMVAGAAKAAATFSELDSCADDRLVLQRPVAPPRLANHPELRHARRGLARISALLDAGEYTTAATHARQAVALAVRLQWPPLEAETRLANASVHSELGNYEEVVEELRTAFRLASASRSDGLAAKAAIMLLRVLGYHLARTDEARQWADVAEASLQRLGRTQSLDAAQLANNLALVYEVVGDATMAETSHHKALSLRQEVLGADHPEAGHSYANLGNVELSRGDLDAALRWHLRALKVRREGLGPGHLDVARSHSSIGRVYLARHRLDEALHYFLLADEIFERNLSGRHRVAARVLDDIGQVQLELGNADAALGYFQRASKLQRELLGYDHHETVRSTMHIGLALSALGHDGPAYPAAPTSSAVAVAEAPR